MRRYRYRARERDSSLRTGHLQADSAEAALQALSARGWFPVEVAEDQGEEPWWRLSRGRGAQRLPVRDQALLARQLADLIGAGVSAAAALELAESRGANRRIKARLAGISERILAGKTLSAALAEQGQVFPDTVIATIRAGEASGSLDSILASTADLLEREAQLRAKLQQSLTYPAIVAFASVLTLGVLFGFLLPRISVLYEDFDQELPGPTRLLLAFAGFLSVWWPAIFGGLTIAAAALYRRVWNHNGRRSAFEAAVVRLPGPGRLLGLSEQVRFARTLSTLLAGGVPAVDALELCEGAVATRAMCSEISRIKTLVSEGEPVAEAFVAGTALQSELTTMVRVGEEAGTLPESLGRAANYLDLQLQQGLTRFTAILEPALIATLAVIVAFIVLSMMLPIFELDASM